MSMVSLTDHVVGENQGKRGIMAKVLLRLDYDTHFEYDSLQIGQLSIKVIQTAFNTLFWWCSNSDHLQSSLLSE